MKREYDSYQFTRWELVRCTILYGAVCLAVSWLFYHSLWPSVCFLPGLWFFLGEERRRLGEERKRRLLSQFLTGIRSMSGALSAGYSAENAVREAWKETEKVYGPEAVFTEELEDMVRRLSLNESLEGLWEELGRRSHLEDLENFGEIFAVARRSGGDLNLIIHNTVESIVQKAEAQQEITVSLASKKMEQKVMSLVPFLILLYVDLAAPEFLAALYHNSLGIGVMSVCLALYVLAFMWGRRIVQIEV